MLTAFLYLKERKEIDMKKLRRIETIKEENKKLKVARIVGLGQNLKANKVALSYKYLIMKPSYKVTLSGNMHGFILIMVVD